VSTNTGTVYTKFSTYFCLPTPGLSTPSFPLTSVYQHRDCLHQVLHFLLSTNTGTVYTKFSTYFCLPTPGLSDTNSSTYFCPPTPGLSTPSPPLTRVYQHQDCLHQVLHLLLSTNTGTVYTKSSTSSCLLTPGLSTLSPPLTRV